VPGGEEGVEQVRMVEAQEIAPMGWGRQQERSVWPILRWLPEMNLKHGITLAA
jgi:hypothetical protein